MMSQKKKKRNEPNIIQCSSLDKACWAFNPVIFYHALVCIHFSYLL